MRRGAGARLLGTGSDGPGLLGGGLLGTGLLRTRPVGLR
jgi:hypothetical protein